MFMAIVRVDFAQSQPIEFAPLVAQVIDATMQTVLNIPARENFIVCQPFSKGTTLYAPEYCSADRLEQIIFIQITLNQGRTTELKNMFFQQLKLALVDTGLLTTENVFVNLVEVARENWSFSA
jgi:phenylpyruvate tautomerase PptA (4-oxalocrotonate tautomerase family)